MLIAFFVAMLVLGLFALRPRTCDVCGSILKRKTYSWTINGQTKKVCPNCSRRLEGEASKTAVGKLLGKNEKKTGSSKQPSVLDVVAKIEAARGPAGRKAALAEGLAQLAPEHRPTLLLEASKVEVQAVLDKVDGLKTNSAKRRNLIAALETLRADPVPDELQTEQIRWLEDALAALSNDDR